MSDLRNLLRDSSYYLSGQVAGLALGFVSFPIFARVFSVAEYGMLCLTLQIAALATVISKMGLQNSIQRYYHEHAASSDVHSLRQFYSTLVIGAALTAACVAILFVACLTFMPNSLIPSAFREVLLLGSGLVFVRALHPIVMAFLRAQRRTKAFNAFDVLAKAVSIAVVCLLLFSWSRSVKAVITGTVVVELISVAVLIALLLPRGMISVDAFNRHLFGASLVFGFPLVGYELAGLILDSGDRLLVQHYMGFQAVGFYSAGYNVSNYVVMSLMYPVNLALLPIYMKLWVSKGPEETQNFLSAALDKFLMVALCLLAAVTVTARSAVIIVGSRKLQQAYPLIPVLVIGLLLYSLHIFFNAGLIIYKRTFTMAKVITFAAALNVALNILLIPRIGLQGAAVSTLLSYAVFLLLIARASFGVLPLRLDIVACLRYLAAACVSMLLASRFQFSSEVVNLVGRGGLSVLSYTAILWTMDGRFRAILKSAVGSAMGFLKEPAREPELVTLSAADADSKG